LSKAIEPGGNREVILSPAAKGLADSQRPPLIAHAQSFHSKQPGKHVERRWKRRAFKRVPPQTVEKVDSRLELELEVVETADLVEKRHRFVITLHEQMLAVVDLIAGLRVRERVGAATEVITPLEQQHLVPEIAQSHACRKAAETASDYDDALRQAYLLNFVRDQMSIAIFIFRALGIEIRLR
jgi:hypothetical protein